MSWIVLVVSGVLEAVWATALDRSEGFTRLGPAAVFLVAAAASMAGLSWALRELPVGTAYAVWVGIGAATTAGWAMATPPSRSPSCACCSCSASCLRRRSQAHPLRSVAGHRGFRQPAGEIPHLSAHARGDKCGSGPTGV